MPITRIDDGDLTTLHVKGTLDMTTADEMQPFVDAIIEEHRMHVTADLAGLDLIDSSGVAALVGLLKRVRAEGGVLTVSGARDQPEAIFKLLRMDKVFNQ